MARPRKASADKRAHQVIFRVTTREYDRLLLRARRLGLQVNELARRTACGQSAPVVTYRRVDPAVISRLDRIGHNLNQLVKRAHIFGQVSPLLPGLCERIDKLVSEAATPFHDR